MFRLEDFFYGLGDFYEMFEEDARIAARVLNVTLTSNLVGGGKKVPMAGIPVYARNNDLLKLTRVGYSRNRVRKMQPIS